MNSCRNEIEKLEEDAKVELVRNKKKYKINRLNNEMEVLKKDNKIKIQKLERVLIDRHLHVILYY